MEKTKLSATSPLQRLVMQFPAYVPYSGFHDLRCFDLPVKVFKKLWKIQKFLHHMETRKDYFKKWHPVQWESAKELSANYQQILFGHA